MMRRDFSDRACTKELVAKWIFTAANLSQRNQSYFPSFSGENAPGENIELKLILQISRTLSFVSIHQGETLKFLIQ